MCAQLGLTLCDPVDCSWPGSSVHGIFQQNYCVAISSSRGLSQSRDQTPISRWILNHWAIWEAQHSPADTLISHINLTPSETHLELLTSSQLVQSLGCVWLFVTPWTAACQASLSITNSQSSLKLMSIESVMPSSHLILCRPLLLLPSIFPSIRVFSNESVLRMRWPKYWSFIFSLSPSNEHPGLISFRMDWLDLLAVQGILEL